jgi:hypothetical protein
MLGPRSHSQYILESGVCPRGSGRPVTMSEMQSSTFSCRALFIGDEIHSGVRNDNTNRSVRNPGRAQIFDQDAMGFHLKHPRMVSESETRNGALIVLHANADGSARARPEQIRGTHLAHFRSPDPGQSSREGTRGSGWRSHMISREQLAQTVWTPGLRTSLADQVTQK